MRILSEISMSDAFLSLSSWLSFKRLNTIRRTSGWTRIRRGASWSLSDPEYSLEFVFAFVLNAPSVLLVAGMDDVDELSDGGRDDAPEASPGGEVEKLGAADAAVGDGELDTRLPKR